MKQKLSWTTKLDGGVKREVRVRMTMRGLKWQFKRSDDERWCYDAPPAREDWDVLEETLVRRTHRGHSLELLRAVRQLRAKAGA